MAKTKLKDIVIKPALGFAQMTLSDLLKRLIAIYEGLLNNPTYPHPPIDLAGFKTTIDALTSAVSAALNGGKAAIVERDKLRADAIIMARLLGHYVESVAKNDMNKFVSSGFVPAQTGKTPPQPVGVPSIVRIDQGNTGQLLLTIHPVSKARTYEVRYAPVPATGAPSAWTTAVIPSTKPASPVNNLTPGTTYTFQVRAFGKLGFSDWSSAVQRMVI